jgi:antitoxin (DNA-binding transcriptional repressor) of toxin-antitoxin stability system
MTTRPPEFDDLLGPEVEGEERERLRRVHDLLVAAGPPPEVSRRGAPNANVVPLRRRGGRRGLLALAAALAIAAAFTIGLVVAVGDEPAVDRVIAMSGPSGASASLEVFEIDEAGNWPMLLDVHGLEPAADGDRFQLWLTKDGKPAALCGSFLTDADGRALVSMNAPWRFSDFDGWAVVEAGSETPLLST